MRHLAAGKLKELGNSILGNFGMSLDNFKMNQDPSTGSWNIRYLRGEVEGRRVLNAFSVLCNDMAA